MNYYFKCAFPRVTQRSLLVILRKD